MSTNYPIKRVVVKNLEKKTRSLADDTKIRNNIKAKLTTEEIEYLEL